MPNRFVQRDGSMVELLTRVPVNRGSLLKGIDHLLKTIETSENAVMIPTLLKDKVRVDACELLFVAKILKASILGHSDLVEFYMNHIGQTSSSLQPVAQSAPASTPNGELLSPSVRLQSSPMASPLLTHAISNHQREQHQQQALAAAASAAASLASAASVASANQTQDQRGAGLSSSHPSSASSGSSSVSSLGSASTATSATLANGSNGAGRSSNGSASWISAQQSIATNESGSSSAGSFSSTISSATEQRPPSASAGGGGGGQDGPAAPTSRGTVQAAPDESAGQEALLVATNKPPLARQAQPPSLLQLTTTNNHINSVSDMLQGAANQSSPSLEHPSSQLVSTKQQQQQQTSAPSAAHLLTPPSSNGTFEGLSISTTAANTGPLDSLGSGTSTPQYLANGVVGCAGTPATQRHELRSSRSAGCLFRANSGASSPRTPNPTTPTTPYPQAETLAGTGGPNGLVGDPSSLVKLLLQVEQLKSSISHCTALLESVVELYKKSIDNIA